MRAHFTCCVKKLSDDPPGSSRLPRHSKRHFARVSWLLERQQGVLNSVSAQAKVLLCARPNALLESQARMCVCGCVCVLRSCVIVCGLTVSSFLCVSVGQYHLPCSLSSLFNPYANDLVLRWFLDARSGWWGVVTGRGREP